MGGLNQFHSLLTTMATWLTVPVCGDGSLWKLYELKPLQTQLMQIKYNASQGKRIYPKKLKQDNHTTVLRCKPIQETFVVKQCKLKPGQLRACE